MIIAPVKFTGAFYYKKRGSSLLSSLEVASESRVCVALAIDARDDVGVDRFRTLVKVIHNVDVVSSMLDLGQMVWRTDVHRLTGIEGF